MSTPTEELRAAAARLRDDRSLKGGVDCNSRELLEMIRALLTAREPLAAWLEHSAVILSGYSDPAALEEAGRLPLAVARAINGAGDPGPGRKGHITDRRSGSYLYEQLRRAAGEAP